MAKEIVTVDQDIEHAAMHAGNTNSRMIFGNPVLMSQFLRNYTGMDIFSDIKPEDIEDVSLKYHAFLGIEFESDTVKMIRIHLHGKEIYVIPLVEHKSDVEYDVAFQLLRYMVAIWYDHAKKHKTEHRNKSFRYPMIIPVVYYEGKAPWTADINFQNRIELVKGMEKYIPSFEYKVVSCRSYSNEKLTELEDEMSFIMLMNRVQSPKEFHEFINTPEEYVKKILGKTTPEIALIIEQVFWSLLMKLQVPVSEAQEAMHHLKEGNMGELFANMEKMDIQTERRMTAEHKERADNAEFRADAAESRANAAESRANAAESRANAAESRANAAESRADAAESRANAAESIIELMIQNTVQNEKASGYSKEEISLLLTGKYQIPKTKAIELIDKYWE